MRQVWETPLDKRLHEEKRRGSPVLSLSGQSPGKLHRMSSEPPEPASTPAKVNFWEKRARRKKEMLDAAKEKSEQAQQPQKPTPTQAQVTSSSHKPQTPPPSNHRKAPSQGSFLVYSRVTLPKNSNNQTLDQPPESSLHVGSLLSSKRPGSLRDGRSHQAIHHNIQV
ncbi:hypothetical protein TNCV_130801 [Trichonephila clavipes]|nr:hypothetical protein TNCV_130801 [Trichonephila clavipes]